MRTICLRRKCKFNLTYNKKFKHLYETLFYLNFHSKKLEDMEPTSLNSVTEYKDIQNGPKSINEFTVEELRNEVTKLLDEKEAIISEVFIY